MKRSFHFLLAAFAMGIALSIIASCEKDGAFDAGGATTKADAESVLGLLTVSDNSVFHVSAADVVNYLVDHTPKGNAKLVEEWKKGLAIIPILQGTEPIMYLANRSDGWFLFSGDKRAPAILAMCETGNMTVKDLFSVGEANVGRYIWLSDMAERLKVLRQSSEYDAASGYLAEWRGADKNIRNLLFQHSSDNAAAYTLQSSLGGTYTDGDDVDLNGWTYVYDDYVGVTYDITDPKVPTLWGQNYPWNKYIPYKTSSSTSDNDRCPAGCVTIAAAQMAYYLHDAIGRPATAPTTAECEGYAGNYTQTFSDFQSTAFDDMALKGYRSTTSTKKSAMFIAYMGKLLGTSYYANSASAYFADIDDAYNKLGILTKMEDFNASTATAAVKSGKPILMAARGVTSGSEAKKAGHAWIADGSKTPKYEYDKVYIYGYDGTVPPEVSDTGNYETLRIRHHSTGSTVVRMNWGWAIEDPVYYSLWSDGWTPSIYTEYKFKYNKRMYRTFTAIK